MGHRLHQGYVFHSRPPLLRYTETCDVARVPDFGYLLNCCHSVTLMLLALSHQSMSANLAKMDLRGYMNTPLEAVLLPTALAKQSGPLKEFFSFSQIFRKSEAVSFFS